MEHLVRKILVVGGNGFLGSAVCKAALARGMQVTSISSSGKPYTTPKGHSPAWTSKVNWQAANALEPSSYSHLVNGTTAVVHTLGTLFEDTPYKTALKAGDLPTLFGTFVSSLVGNGTSNPLAKPKGNGETSYERMNRDSALHVCQTFLSSEQVEPTSTPGAEGSPPSSPRPFVYISAEDIFRPFIPARYIETKREAEIHLENMIGNDNPHYRGVYIRPSLIYHPHFRPLTSPLAALLDLSSVLHSQVPKNMPIPTPSGVLRSIASAVSQGQDAKTSVHPSALESVANALTIPPIHVDHVAEAVCVAVEQASVRGIVGVREMRELIGWSEKGELRSKTALP